jgi:transcriptional regulator with XRE-family HTH domain
MTRSKKLKAFVDEAKQSDAYWVESAKLEFALALEQQRRAAGLSYADLAKKMGTSAAYISKVFRGDNNLTIESMVKLARATGGQLDARFLVEENTTTAYSRKS